MIKKIFILNAPPRTGKDTIANSFEDSDFDYSIESFKKPLYEIAATTLGLPLDAFMDFYETDGWKDSKQEICNNKTPRELMIHISENYIKPFFGNDYFGKQLANRIKKAESLSGEYQYIYTDCIIIPDGGFDAEVTPLVEEFGKDVVEVIQLEREGYRDFKGDSRSWINIPNITTNKFDTTDGNEEVIKYIKSRMINGG